MIASYRHESARGDLVAAGRYLPDLPTIFSRYQWRRGRRPAGNLSVSVLSDMARRGCRLDFADLPIADGGLRIRRRPLLRDRSAVRNAGRLQPARRRSAPAQPQGYSGLRSQSYVRPAFVVP